MQYPKLWPFVEAKKLLANTKDSITFQTGYGASGLPHIGTFGEVLRTSFVKKAFEHISGKSSRIIVFSDDMDGLRKVPTNVPSQEMMQQFIGFPLSDIPDPFGEYHSFADYNNAKLRSFLDSFGFAYEFLSSTSMYKSGAFDTVLLRFLEYYEEIMEVMLPTLGPERRMTYSPFMPICKTTGKVLEAKVVAHDDRTITYINEDGKFVTTEVTQGQCKLQWKCDWAMRWAAFDVDYEMHGKDLIDSFKLSSKICKIVGGKIPESMVFELFLDEEQKKISKTKGNGLTVNDWVLYAPIESLAYYMYQNPKSAKRLCFDVIPRAVDEYLQFLKSFYSQPIDDRIKNPIWFISGIFAVSEDDILEISFSMLLTLAIACNAMESSILWKFVEKYKSIKTTCSFHTRCINGAVAYFSNVIARQRQYIAPSEKDKNALYELAKRIEAVDTLDAAGYQEIVYQVGKDMEYEDLRDWFAGIYSALFGTESGPRFGSFIHIYGAQKTVSLIRSTLDKSAD